MTRSIRRRPYAPFCAGARSQKRDKQTCSRALRRGNKVNLRVDGEDAAFARPAEALDAWSMTYDGSRRYAPYDPAGSLGYYDWWRWAKGK